MMLQMKWLSLPATIFMSPALFASGGGFVVTGQITYTDRQPLRERIELRLPSLHRLYFTDDAGSFRLEDIPPGRLTIYMYSAGELSDSLLIFADEAFMNLGTLPLIPTVARSESPDALPNVDQELGTAPNEDDAIPLQASMLLNGRDLFLSNAFSLVAAGYRPRGYNAYPAVQMFGGVWIDETLNQSASLLWSGLTDIMRNALSSKNLEANEEAFGSLNGVRTTNVHAIYQSPQHRLSYSGGNRSYDHKLQFTYCSEPNRNNWTWSFSGFRQWARETYVPGTATDHWAGYASATREFLPGRTLSASIIYHYSFREPRSAATNELFALSGSTLYNSNWGWQNGVKRNARSVTEHLPFAIWEYSDRSSTRREWVSAIALSVHESAYEGLDWYRAPDPRPDYYRNLPSYIAISNPAGAASVDLQLRSHPEMLQVDWQQIYNANTNNIDSTRYLDGGQYFSKVGKQALYVEGSEMIKSQHVYLRSHIKQQWGSSGQFVAGACWNEHFSERYKQLTDLLGGEYFIDLNDFARRQYPNQPELWTNNVPKSNHPLYKGDRYKYDYRIHARSILTFAQWEQDFSHWTIFGSAEARLSSYSRTGVFINGMYPDLSFGKGRIMNFPGYQFKGGLTRKINGRHYLSVRFLYGKTTPANFDQIYIAAPVREQIAGSADDLSPQVMAAEMVYTVHAPRFNIQISAYQTETRKGTQILRYYNDEPEFQCFVNMIQQNLAQRHTGVEATATYSFNPGVSFYLIGALGQTFYTRNPQVLLYSDNDTSLSQSSKSVEIANYYSVTGPQTVAGAGIQIEGRRHWSIKLGLGYLDRNYVRINPSRRTAAAAENIDPATDKGKAVFAQEKLMATYYSDCMLSKSFRIRNAAAGRTYNFYCFLNVSNVLNLSRQKTFGYEQLRYDFANNDPTKFPNKYVYGPGRTCSAGVQIKW